MAVSFLAQVARALERGRWDSSLARAVASAISPLAARSLVRPARVPPSVAVVCIGGATLGGSGKTRVAVACARYLSARARVVLVGHAYRAAPHVPRVVRVGDELDEVGDEALVAARALAPFDVPVVVANARQAAIDHALLLRPSILVLDGPLRLTTSGAGSLSILAVDSERPWGSGNLPPAGDLRAPQARLLAEADLVVPVEALPVAVKWPNETVAPLASLRGRRWGLFTAMARPDRLAHALENAGIAPAAVVSAPDHGPARGCLRALRDARVEAWMGTAKCAAHLESLGLKAPVGTLLGEWELGPFDARLEHALAEFEKMRNVGSLPT